MNRGENTKTRVLFVCMGNICRSPTAEAVFRHQVIAAGFENAIHIDSAGTHDYHIGAPPDPRAQKAAARRGYDATELRARQVDETDFEVFDYILAMDRANLAILERECPPQYSHKLGLLMQYSERYSEGVEEVPDPYFGGNQGFEHVLNMVEEAGRGLLIWLRGENS
ncbi:low molecular weight protein-tyrosine-phosphatase [Nitrosospira sp. NRS527]|uniref:low molecular weight protein-tyrosine-phosphatase n=1 Tax=Nitrosospira sp. NRS527 TaxID=155925 RepID=UPI001AF82F73|nr:low molecular weight protein-tyrosine-phosphatase [Nitrosospira sp. NRS527]BCT67504.1 Putative low molecular weight protein-tyrosine-phosphatase [Nitrosospira sp. NRS527]